MDVMAIMALIQKGLSVAEIIIEAGRDAAPAIKALIALAAGAQQGTVTQEQVDDTEALLDRLIAEFNEPLPE